MAEIVLKPESEHDFELLFSMEKDRLDMLISKLKDSEPGLSPQEISENLYNEMGMNSDDLEKIIKVIYGINQVKLSSGFEVEEVINDFLNALSEFENQMFESDHCRDYLRNILNIEGTIFLTVSAKNLAYSREKILMDSDIETDIRPIFNEDELKGLVVVHTIKIDFVENGKSDSSNTIYLALDKNDMDKLEKLIQRAKLRESSLKANIPNVFVKVD